VRPISLVRILRLSLAAIAIATAAPALADGVLPSQASAVQREQAQSRFQRGKELMGKKSYDEALVEFRASHDIVASPNARLEIARCLLATGKLVDAYAEFGRTSVEAKELAAEDKRYQLAFDSATTERASLQPQLGFVSLTVQNPSDATRVTIGGEEIRRAAWTEPAPVIAGTTAIVVNTPGHADVTRSVTLAAGANTSLTIDAQSGALTEGPAIATSAEPPPAAPSGGHGPLRTLAYVAGGIGVAGIATFAISGALAHSAYDDLQSACGAGPCPPSKADEIASGRTRQTVANVGLAVGIVGVAAGATLFVISLKRETTAPSVALMVAPAWVGLGGKL
jgi:hypothetical protein